MEDNKKEVKKISLTTYVISLIIMAIVVAICMVIFLNKNYEIKENDTYTQEINQQISSTQNRIDSNDVDKNEYTSYNTNKSSIENNTNASEIIKKGINVDSNNIEWEEYPENMNKEISKMSKDFEFLVDQIEGNDSRETKTLYSYLKNGYNDYSILKQYYEGDGTEIIRKSSNYPQFDDNSQRNVIYRYSDKIICEIATLNEALYCFDNLEEKSEREQEIEQAKMESAQNAKISEKVACQWNNLKKLTEYNGHSNLSNKSYYYQINKMVIMNGYNNSEYWYKTNARAKKIKVTINNDKEYVFDLKDTNKAQEFSIDYKQNSVEKPVNIEIEVLEKYNGEKIDDVYISDIQFGITSNIPQGR